MYYSKTWSKSWRKALLAVVAVAASATVLADYRGELKINYISGETDIGGYSIPDYTPPPTGGPDPDPGTPPLTPPPSAEVPGTEEDYDGFSVAGEVFFEPVDTSRGPTKLAPFMSRASSVGGEYGRLETDSGIESDIWSLFTRVFVSDRFVLEAAFGGVDADSNASEGDVDVYTAALGYYVAEYTQLKLGYDNIDNDLAEADRYRIDVEFVRQLDNGMTFQGKALVGLVNEDNTVFGNNDGTDIELEASWFFNHGFGVGGEFAWQNRDDGGERDGFNLWANYFPTDKISLELSYYQEDFDLGSGVDLETDGFEFEASYRF